MAIIRGNARKNKLNGTNGKDSIFGLSGNDTLIGKNGNDKLFGGAGNDKLDGGKGKDQLVGGGGNDLLIGGAGGDKLVGGGGTDTASYATAKAGVTAVIDVATRAFFPQTGDAAGDTFNSVENLLGSNFNDILIGSAANNKIDGGSGDDELGGLAGDDQLFGGDGDGDDILEGGTGADQLFGGAGFDLASYFFASDRVTVHLDGADFPGFETAGEAIGDTFNSIEGVVGSQFNDDIFGDAGANFLSGEEGGDLLAGGLGADTILTGANGGDGDIVYFDDEAEGGDVVLDFSAGDFILVNADNFGGNLTNVAGLFPNPLPLDPMLFIANAAPVAPVDTIGYFLFDTDDFLLLWDVDAQGGADPVLIASFANNYNLQNTEILVLTFEP